MGVLDDVNLYLVNDTDGMSSFMRWLGERRDVLGVDTETTGFSHHRDKIRLIQFGDINTGWAIPWERWSGVAIEALNKYEAPIVLHNSQFDMRFITTHAGKDLTRWKWDWCDDTMTMAHLLDPKRPKGLKPLAAMHIDTKAVAAQGQLDAGMADNKWSYGTVPIDYPPYWIYAAMDPVLTCRLHQKFKPAIDSSYREVYNLEMGVLRVLANMMLKGARVNPDYVTEMITKLSGWTAKALDWTTSEYGVTSSMANQKIVAAFDRLGVKIPHKLTNSGNQAMDKEVLELIEHPLAETILQIRKFEKQIGPYFKHFLNDADENGRVHPTIWGLGTRTGRMSITDPALQTLPKRDPTVRKAIIPSEDHHLVSIDADQIEARLAAHFSGDMGMRDAFLADGDFFVELTKQIYDDQTVVKSDPRRALTKGVVYGKLYGAGVPTMAVTARVSEDQMGAIVSKFDTTFPGVRRLQLAIEGTARQRIRDEGEAYVITPMGRKLYSDKYKEYTLMNYLIQSHAAEVFKKNLLLLDAAGFGDYLILPVHDEVVMDVPADSSADILREAELVMNDDTTYSVPITWSGEIMKTSWGAKSD